MKRLPAASIATPHGLSSSPPVAGPPSPAGACEPLPATVVMRNGAAVGTNEKELGEAAFRPAAVATRLKTPARSTIRLLKVARPFTAATVAVPLSTAPLPPA